MYGRFGFPPPDRGQLQLDEMERAIVVDAVRSAAFKRLPNGTVAELLKLENLEQLRTIRAPAAQVAKNCDRTARCSAWSPRTRTQPDNQRRRH